jgi:hypothetical protein
MGKLIDLTNQRFGFWVVIKRGVDSAAGQTCWLCKCECGKVKEVSSNSLRSGNSTSCGCNNIPDLTNIEFGKLKVLELDSHINGVRKWLCVCLCGKQIVVNTYRLRENITTSCGCDKTNAILKDDVAKNILRMGDLIKKQKKIILDLTEEIAKGVKIIEDAKKLVVGK